MVSWHDPPEVYLPPPPPHHTCDGRGVSVRGDAPVGDAERAEPGDRGDAFSERRGEGTAVTGGSWSVPKRGNLCLKAFGRVLVGRVWTLIMS